MSDDTLNLKIFLATIASDSILKKETERQYVDRLKKLRDYLTRRIEE